MLGAEVFYGTFWELEIINCDFCSHIPDRILSGLHPAYVISSYNPVAALKQKFITEESNGISLKKILVTIQFSISVFMLIVGFIIYRQTQYHVKQRYWIQF